jgi:hypothetical protein
MAQLPLARQLGLIIEELPDEVLVYDSDRDTALCLNRSIAFVWRHCDGKTTPERMARLVEQEFQVGEGCEIVSLALSRLEKAHLLTAPATIKFGELSRRELVRRLGVSAAALPVIALIQTQPAGQIASCTQNQGSCVFNTDCCSGCCSDAVCAPPNVCFAQKPSS